MHVKRISLNIVPYSAPLPLDMHSFRCLSLQLPLPLPLISSRELRRFYGCAFRLINKHYRQFSLIAILQIRKRLRWAVFFAFLRAYVAFWKRVLLSPKTRFEKMVNHNSILLLFAALRGRVFARPQPVTQNAPAVAACSPLELVIGMSKFHAHETSNTKICTQARGTTEPLLPDYGIVVGDPVFQAVKQLLPEATGYKVDYPASFEPTSRNVGRDDIVKHLTEQAKKCPNQKYAMVGYSQGADVVHSGVAQLDPSLYPRIVALVMFGDPGTKSLQ